MLQISLHPSQLHEARGSMDPGKHLLGPDLFKKFLKTSASVCLSFKACLARMRSSGSYLRSKIQQIAAEQYSHPFLYMRCGTISEKLWQHLCVLRTMRATCKRLPHQLLHEFDELWVGMGDQALNASALRTFKLYSHPLPREDMAPSICCSSAFFSGKLKSMWDASWCVQQKFASHDQYLGR